MPSSDTSNIQLIVDNVIKLKPNKILDVGPGCGKYGLMFREYLDGHRQGRGFHKKDTWKVIIDCCEIFEEYLTPAHYYIYDSVFKCDIWDLHRWDSLRTYDLIFLGDVLEHFEKGEAIILLEHLRSNFLSSKGCILISTPNFESKWDKPLPFGNVHEKHLCRFKPEDFRSLPNLKWEWEVAKKLLTVLLRSKS